MPPDISQIILDELRALSDKTQTWMQDTGERLKSVETKVDMFLDKDMEGSLPQLQQRVRALEKRQWTIGGGLTLLGTLIGWATRFLPTHIK